MPGEKKKNRAWMFLGICLFFLGSSSVQAAKDEPETSLSIQAQWVDMEAGLAKVTLKEREIPTKVFSAQGKTDYIFMMDNSRSVVINDKFLMNGDGGDREPITKSNCPCLNREHYYRRGGTNYTLINYDSGYVYGTSQYVTGLTRYKMWKDNGEGYHCNRQGQRIPVRYANGCTDVFTLSKTSICEMIDQIAARRDGSRIAFWGYGDGIYGKVGLTTDYERVKAQVRGLVMYPGSSYSAPLAEAVQEVGSGDKALSTKVIFMGDGKPDDWDKNAALSYAQRLREKPGTSLYTFSIGTLPGSAEYQFMLAMAGYDTSRCRALYNNFPEQIKQVLTEAVSSQVEVEVVCADKTVQETIYGDAWDYAGGLWFSRGSGQVRDGVITWSIPGGEARESLCTFLIQLKASWMEREKPFRVPVSQSCHLNYRILGGPRHNQTRTVPAESPRLVYIPKRNLTEELRTRIRSYYGLQEKEA